MNTIPTRDREILRDLARKKAEIGQLPIQEERRRLWTALNDLRSVRPMLWVFEIPWCEMDVDGELDLRCESEICRRFELPLRRELYQWQHLPDDMIVLPFIGIRPALRDTGIGIWEDVDIVRTDEASSVVSRHYHIQIKDEADIEKINMPEVSLDAEAWDRNLAFARELFGDAIEVRKIGITGTSIAPWDILVRLTGVQEVLMDMCVRPAYVHRMIARMTEAFTRRLDQYEALNVLAYNNDTWSGGGFLCTDELPPADSDPTRIRPRDMWGRTMSQIFSAVSPDMHEEFALQYECRWLHRFGLTYYGCCEPLDRKVDILRKNVPNLRKISMSPWIDVDIAAENVGTDYVFSYKPNPAVLTDEGWDPPRIRRDLKALLDRLEGLHVELIMKDISTVCYKPKRLWEWTRIASEVVNERA